MAVTKRESGRQPIFFSRSAEKEPTAGERIRLLADRADFVAGSIFLFDNRDPEGDLLEVETVQLSETEQSARFVSKFSRRLRGLFKDLKAEDLVTDEDLPLFYWPQTDNARIRLAWRLREIAVTARRDSLAGARSR